jgi:hypothetical protein
VRRDGASGGGSGSEFEGAAVAGKVRVAGTRRWDGRYSSRQANGSFAPC